MTSIEEYSKKRDELLAELFSSRDKGIEAVTKEFERKKQEIIASFQSNSALIEKSYKIQASNVLAIALTRDNDLLNNKKLNVQSQSILALPDEERTKARDVAEEIKRERDPVTYEKLKGLLYKLNPSAGFIGVVEQLLESKPTNTQVMSYIAMGKSNGAIIYYILSPIRESNGRQLLENSLEGIILKTIAENRLSEDTKVNLERGDTVSKVEPYSIEFDSDILYANSFLLSTLKPYQQDPETAGSLMNLLKASFEKNQPKELVAGGLKHNLEKVEMPVIDFFKSHTLDQIATLVSSVPELGKKYVTLKEAAKIADKHPITIVRAATKGLIKKDLTGNYDLDSVERFAAEKKRSKRILIESNEEIKIWREDAQKKLAKFRGAGAEYLTINQFQNILGITSRTFIYKLLHEGELDSEQEESGAGRYVIQVDNAARFIDRYTPKYRVQKGEDNASGAPRIKRETFGGEQEALRKAALQRLENIAGVDPLYVNHLKDVFDISYSAANDLAKNRMKASIDSSSKKAYSVPYAKVKTFIETQHLPKKRT